MNQEHIANISQDDSFAQTIDWSPCKKGGASYKSRDLVETRLERLEYKPVFIAKLIPGIFLLNGFCIAFGSLAFPALVQGGNLVPILFGSFTFGLGFFAWRWMNYPIYFDLQRKFASIGYQEEKVRFDDIYAIQLIPETVTQSSRSHGRRRTRRYRSYRSYELNLVLKNSQRVNVVDHGKLDAIRQDAQLLAKLIEVPVWDGI